MTLTLQEYAFYPSPVAPEYGLLFMLDEEGNRWTLQGEPEDVWQAIREPNQRVKEFDPIS